MGALITDAYRELCAEMHAQHPWGTKGHTYVGEFRETLDGLACVSVLNYGCGRNTLKDHLPGFEVVGYDPAIEIYAADPTPADFVVCTDVMEHVEKTLVLNVLEHIHRLARKGAYFNIALTKAKRFLPNGENAHITLRSSEWWMEQIRRLDWVVDKESHGRKTLKVHLRKV